MKAILIMLTFLFINNVVGQRYFRDTIIFGGDRIVGEVLYPKYGTIKKGKLKKVQKDGVYLIMKSDKKLIVLVDDTNKFIDEMGKNTLLPRYSKQIITDNIFSHYKKIRYNELDTMKEEGIEEEGERLPYIWFMSQDERDCIVIYEDDNDGKNYYVEILIRDTLFQMKNGIKVGISKKELLRKLGIDKFSVEIENDATLIYGFF